MLLSSQNSTSKISITDDNLKSEVGMNTNVRTSALHSENLLRGMKTVQILHKGSIYKLQATKLGKLILTK